MQPSNRTWNIRVCSIEAFVSNGLALRSSYRGPVETRCRRPTDVRPLIEKLAAFAGTHWTADSIHLVRAATSAPTCATRSQGAGRSQIDQRAHDHGQHQRGEHGRQQPPRRTVHPQNSIRPAEVHLWLM